MYVHSTGFIIRSPFLLIRMEAVATARENLLVHTPRMTNLDDF